MRRHAEDLVKDPQEMEGAEPGPGGRALEVARTAAEMAGQAIVIKVDTERYPELASRFNVRGIPNFVVFYRGRPVLQQAGLANHEQMENWLKSAAQTSVA